MSLQKNAVLADTIDSYTFSDSLVPDYELSWELKKSKVSYQGEINLYFIDQYIWAITPMINLTLGDIFKIKLLEDPDDIVTSNYTDYFFGGDSWAEFYVNSVLLSDNASSIAFDDLYVYNSFSPLLLTRQIPVFLILPTVVEVEGTEISYFDYLADVLQQYVINSRNYKYEIVDKKEKFAIECEYNNKGMSFIGLPSEKEEIFSVVYNQEWGVLSRIEYTYHYKQGDNNIEIEILFEILNEEIVVVVPFEWAIGFSVLFVAGVITLYRKKKRK